MLVYQRVRETGKPHISQEPWLPLGPSTKQPRWPGHVALLLPWQSDQRIAALCRWLGDLQREQQWKVGGCQRLADLTLK